MVEYEIVLREERNDEKEKKTRSKQKKRTILISSRVMRYIVMNIYIVPLRSQRMSLPVVPSHVILNSAVYATQNCI